MTVLASGSKGNSTVIASAGTRILVDAGLSCRELLKRMALAGEDPTCLDAILVTHEHQDHIAGLGVLARRLRIPVFFTEPTHRAWVRMLTPRTTMTYAKWLDHLQQEKAVRTAAQAHPRSTTPETSGSPSNPAQGIDTHISDPSELQATANLSSELGTLDPLLQDTRTREPEALCEPSAGPKADPASLPVVEYFRAGTAFSIGDIDITPFTIPHDAADPCGFVFASRTETIRMAIATDLGYIPPNVKAALRNIDVLLLESNHDLEMLKDGPYPWSVKQRVLSRVGHLSNDAAAEFLQKDYDGGAHCIVLGHLSESNNVPELARIAAERALGLQPSLLGNRILLAPQHVPLDPICL